MKYCILELHSYSRKEKIHIIQGEKGGNVFDFVYQLYARVLN